VPYIFDAFDLTLDIAKQATSSKFKTRSKRTSISYHIRGTVNTIIRKVNKDKKYTIDIKRENIALRISHINISRHTTANNSSRETEISVFSSEKNNKLTVTLETLEETLMPEDLSVIQIPKSAFSDPDKLQSIASVVYKNTELFRNDLSISTAPLRNLVTGTIGSVVHSLVIGDKPMGNLLDPITLVFKKINTNTTNIDGINGVRKGGYHCAYWVPGNSLQLNLKSE